MKIVIIMPTYNEKVNMEKMIPILEEDVMPKVKNHELSILVADDKSPDGTADVVKDFMKKYKNLELLIGDKQGLGAAYVRAMHYAMDEMKAGAVIEFDADFQHDPHDIPRLISAMDEGHDYVIGSRYVPGGAIPKEWGLSRKIMSYFGSMFARIVWLNFSVHDMTSGYKLTKTEYLKKIDLDHLYSKYYAYKMHILHDVLKSGAKVKEVPIIFYERKEGSSKISRKDLFDSLSVVIRLRMRDSQRVIKFLIVGGTGFIFQVIAQEGSIRSGFTYLLATMIKPLVPFLSQYSFSALADGFGAAIGAEFAILSNFLFNNFWTFSDTAHIKERSSFIIRLIKFNIASLASIIIQFLSVFIMEHIVGENIKILSFVIKTRIVVLFPTIILIIIPLNYIIYNKLIWKTHKLSFHNE